MSNPGNQTLQKRWLSYAATACLCVAATAAHAAPPDSGDALLRMLRDNGVVATVPPDTDASRLTLGARALSLPAGIAASVRDRTSEMVLTAMNFLGVRYVRGGSSAETGFDCSGFTRHIFENTVGLVLPRSADEQARADGMVPVAREELRPGDLVFFNTLRRTFSHVGIYIGEGKFIHSPRAGGAVRVEDMGVRYWNARYTGARRASLTDNP